MITDGYIYSALLSYALDPSLQGDAAPLQALHGRQLQEHRRPQQDQLQHSLRPQDPHDHLSRNGATRIHGLAVDNRQLDAPSVWEVSAECSVLGVTNQKPSLLPPATLVQSLGVPLEKKECSVRSPLHNLTFVLKHIE